MSPAYLFVPILLSLTTDVHTWH